MHRKGDYFYLVVLLKNGVEVSMRFTEDALVDHRDRCSRMLMGL